MRSSFVHSRLQLQGEVAVGDRVAAYRGMFRTALGIAKEEVHHNMHFLTKHFIQKAKLVFEGIFS